MVTDPKIIVALDFPDRRGALACAGRLAPDLCRLKIGMELFTAEGPDLVAELADRGFDVFLDLKFHDIPATVAKAVAAAARLGVWMVNVHALGGPKQLLAAAQAVREAPRRPLLIAVTILTSMDGAQMEAAGIWGGTAEAALRLARLSRDCGLDGVVCSALEVPGIKERCGGDFICVTPGIRPQGAALNDQVRVMTPQRALACGSDYLVIGRPITGAADPQKALLDILSGLS